MVFERKYSDEVRELSVEAVLRRRREEPGNRAIVREVADEFDVGPQSLRLWVARYDDGSYDLDSDSTGAEGDPNVANRYARQTRAELVGRIIELERRVETLIEDNRSLSRVVTLLGEELRRSI